MANKWPLVVGIGAVLLLAAIIYLAQAVEPERGPAVEVIERDQLAR